MQLSHNDIRAMEDILDRMERIAAQKQQIQEDVKAIAERLDEKPAKIKKVISLMEKERAKGGVIDAESEILDMARSATGQ
jgi:cytochrome c556